MLYEKDNIYNVCAYIRGSSGVMVIVVGNGHSDTSSNPNSKANRIL